MDEVRSMCEAIDYYLERGRKLGFAEGKAEGKADGKADGEIIGAVKTYSRIGKLPSEIIKLIEADYGLAQETAEKYVEQTLGLQPA